MVSRYYRWFDNTSPWLKPGASRSNEGRETTLEPAVTGRTEGRKEVCDCAGTCHLGHPRITCTVCTYIGRAPSRGESKAMEGSG